MLEGQIIPNWRSERILYPRDLTTFFSSSDRKWNRCLERSKKEQKEQKLIIFEEEDTIIYSSPSFVTVTNTYSTRNGWAASIYSKLNSISLAYFLPFFFVLSKLYHYTQFFSFIIECETESRAIKGKQIWKTSLLFLFFSNFWKSFFSKNYHGLLFNIFTLVCKHCLLC